MEGDGLNPSFLDVETMVEGVLGRWMRWWALLSLGRGEELGCEKDTGKAPVEHLPYEELCLAPFWHP